MMSLLLLCLSLVVVEVSSSSQGAKYVGVGYNLLTANPDGENVAKGGIDPGILVTRRILAVSPGSNPPEVYSTERHSCATLKESHVFYDAKTYQDKLNRVVKFGAHGLIHKLIGFSFSTSHRYSSIHDSTSKQHEVFYDAQTNCNLGRARYEDELARAKRFSVSENFAAVICNLPTIYSPTAYMSLLDNWGTHVIKEVELGKRTIQRYKSTLSEFFEHVQKVSGHDVSLSGSYMGFGASMSMNFEKFKDSSNYNLQFGSRLYTLETGSTTLPEPIGLTIDSIASVLDSKYWQTLDTFKHNHLCMSTMTLKSLEYRQKNLLKALDNYASYKRAHAAAAQQLKIPITWPQGTYGIPKARTGCPSNGVTWHEGWRNEVYLHHSVPNALYGAPLHKRFIFGHHHTHTETSKMEYCMKGDTSSSPYDMAWPAGSYCIYKYGRCPSGFRQGSLSISESSNGGTLPDGYHSKANEYCCREDGLPTHEIMLPSTRPFFLFKYTRGCQLVHGMRMSEQWIQVNGKHSGAVPTLEGGKLPYCYYMPNTYAHLIIG